MMKVNPTDGELERDLEQPSIEELGFSEQSVVIARPKDHEDKQKKKKGKTRKRVRLGGVALVVVIGMAVGIAFAASSGRGGGGGSEDESQERSGGGPEDQNQTLAAEETNAPTNSTGSGGLLSGNLLSAELLSKSINAVHMSKEIYQDNVTDIIPGATVYYDDIDAALWVKQDDVCYVVFRATTSTTISSVRDWLSNIPLLPPISFESPNGYLCRTQRGFYNSYFEVSFKNELVKQAEQCVHSCDDGVPCELVLAGGSQGGALAALAAVDMYHLNPLLVTVGQPKTLFDEPGEEPCSNALNTDRYLRFLNAVSGPRNRIPGIQRRSNETVLKYDAVPQMPALISEDGEDDLGQLIVLGEDTDTNPSNRLVWYPMGVSRDRVPMDQWGSFNIHKMTLYRSRLRALQTSMTSGGVSLEGWTNGALCSFNSECESSSVCYNQVCVAKSDLPEDYDSEEETLPDELPCEGACQDKLEDGAFCRKDDHCQSGNCFIVCREGSPP